MTTWPSTRRKVEGTLHLLSLRLPYGPLPPLHFYIASLSLSLPDTAFPRINNSAQRNTSRKTLFNLDERERVYITAAGAYPFSTRAPRELRSR